MYYRVRINKSQYRKNPLVLRNLGVRFEQDAINRPKGFPLWQLFYGVSGRGTFYLEGGQGILRPGQIVLLYPGEGHRYQSAAGDWLMHYIGFDGVLCQELLYTLGMTRSGIFSLSSPDAFLRHLKASPDLALGEVAEACGFHSSSYFCKVFRETTGLTPQAFRIGGTEKNTKP